MLPGLPRKRVGDAAGAVDTRAGLGRRAANLAAGALSELFTFVFSLVLVSASVAISQRVPLDALTPLAEAELGRISGGEARLDEGQAYVSPGGLTVRAAHVLVSGPTDIEAEEAEVTLGWRALLSGEPSVDFLAAETLAISVAGGPTPGPRAISFEGVRDLFLGGRVGVVELPSLDVLIDQGPFAPVRLRGGAVSAGPDGEGYRAEARLPFMLGGREALTTLDVAVERGGAASALFRSEGTPLSPLLKLAGIDAVDLDSRLEGTVSIDLGADGRMKAAAADLLVPPGTGNLAGQPFGFGENRLRARIAEGAPDIELIELLYDVENNKGALSGTLSADNLDRPAELVLDFDVQGDDLRLDLKSFMDGPLSVGEMAAAGRFDAAARHLAFKSLSADYFGSVLEGALALTFPEGFDGSPKLVADASLPGPLRPDEELAGWPRPLAAAARNWVVANLRSGRLTDLAYTADIPMNAIRPATPLPDDAMQFTFNAAEAQVTYLPDMPPIENLVASAVVRGNSFEVAAEEGTVAGVGLGAGSLDIPRFTPGGATAVFRTRLNGRVPRVLTALEEAGFVDFDEQGYQPEVFRGRGRFDLEIAWPIVADLKPEDVRIEGSGAFSRGAIDDVLPGIDATDADGVVLLDNAGVTVSGQGLAASSPATFKWRQSFGERAKADLRVDVDIDTLAADMIGLPLRQFFRGTVSTAVWAEDLRPGAPLVISGDLQDASVQIDALGLRKPRGEAGAFETVMRLPERAEGGLDDELLTITSLKLTSPSFNIEGSGLFTTDGAVRRLELPRLFIEDQANLSLRLLAEESGLDVDVTGARFDAAPVLDAILSSSPSGPGQKLPGRAAVEVQLDTVALRNGVEIRNLDMEAAHSGQVFEHLFLTANLGGDEVMSATLDRPVGHGLGYVEIEATEFATLLEGTFGIASVSGAPGSLKGTVMERGGFRGRLELGELIVRDAPTLALILGAMSLDGLGDVLNGDGIRFQKLEGDVWLKDGKLGLGDAKLVGSSLGMSANGVVDLEAGTIDMRGAVAPAYAVNSFLGAIPGIGRLFVNREGEGIVAFAYQISGSLEQPTVTVNALSALTPGILRRMFEPVAGGPAETGELLDAAIAETRRGDGDVEDMQ